MEFLGPRKSLRRDVQFPELVRFSQDFSMYRIIYTKSVYNAATFACLEHLCRPFFSMQEFMRITKKFQPSLKEKLMSAKTALKYGFNPFLALEKAITKKEVKEVAILDYTIFVHSIDYKNTEIIRTLKLRKSPLVNLITNNDSQILLYNEITTFIDGFDPLTGNATCKNIPLELLDGLDSFFYYQTPKDSNKTNLSYECTTVYDSLLEVPDLEPQQFARKPLQDDDHPDTIENELIDFPTCQCFKKQECKLF